MNNKKAMLLLLVAVCSSGCGNSVQPRKPEAAAPVSQADQLRQKARITEAASMVGYDGKAIRKNLDKIIDESEEAKRQLKQIDGL